MTHVKALQAGHSSQGTSWAYYTGSPYLRCRNISKTLTESELLKALKSTKQNKSPGNYGLPSEFYKVFWNDIKCYLLNALNASYYNKKLSITQKRGGGGGGLLLDCCYVGHFQNSHIWKNITKIRNTPCNTAIEAFLNVTPLCRFRGITQIRIEVFSLILFGMHYVLWAILKMATL